MNLIFVVRAVNKNVGFSLVVILTDLLLRNTQYQAKYGSMFLHLDVAMK